MDGGGHWEVWGLLGVGEDREQRKVCWGERETGSVFKMVRFRQRREVGEVTKGGGGINGAWGRTKSAGEERCGGKKIWRAKKGDSRVGEGVQAAKSKPGGRGGTNLEFGHPRDGKCMVLE